MKSLFDLIFRLATAALLLFFVNSVLELNIPVNLVNILIITLLETKGLLVILALHYFT